MSDEVISAPERPLYHSNSNFKRGGIRLFGCQLRLASDDFVLPAWIAFLTRIFYLIATGSIMAYSMQIIKMGPSCLNMHYLDIYMPTAVGFMLANGILYLILAIHR